MEKERLGSSGSLRECSILKMQIKHRYNLTNSVDQNAGFCELPYYCYAVCVCVCVCVCLYQLMLAKMTGKSHFEPGKTSFTTLKTKL
jgi:hypothetical protein